MIEVFVWAGRSRVARNTITGTITQPVGRGGLGLLIIEQYRAMVGNIMIWVLGKESHLLRSILCTHIQDLSVRRWGITDFTWIVAGGGRGASLGSLAWRNFCKAWSFIKIFICCRKPRNILEWRLLPLWRPHLNHRNPKLVRCTSKAQHRIREMGLVHMGDILTQDEMFRTWADLHPGGGEIGWEKGRTFLFWRICILALWWTMSKACIRYILRLTT